MLKFGSSYIYPIQTFASAYSKDEAFPFGNISLRAVVAPIDFPAREYYIWGMEILKTEDISSLIKKRRKSLNLTQAECAAFCGVGIRFFSELENGKQSLHLGKVLQVLQTLGLKIHITENGDNK